jgi:hypothetical protein
MKLGRLSTFSVVNLIKCSTQVVEERVINFNCDAVVLNLLLISHMAVEKRYSYDVLYYTLECLANKYGYLELK